MSDDGITPNCPRCKMKCAVWELSGRYWCSCCDLYFNVPIVAEFNDAPATLAEERTKP